MAEITMPKMSDTMEEGTIVKWLKHEGDPVEQGEVIAEIETDKANVEMESFDSGVITRIIAHEGDKVQVGQPIAEVQAQGAAAQPAPAEAAGVASPPAKGELGEVPEVPAPAPTVAPYTPAEAAAVVSPPAKGGLGGVPETPVAKPPSTEERILASPIARRMAAEKGIDLTQVHGTGPDGRIVEADIQNFGKQPSPPVKGGPGGVPETQAPAAVSPPAKAGLGGVPETQAPSEARELSKIRKTIAERMTHAKQTIPHFYVTTEIDMDWAAKLRDDLNSDVSEVKISFTDMIIKACALALEKFPEANASFADGKMLVHQNINVGMAVALDEGLVDPVIHDANKKSLRQIAQETKTLAQRARDNKLTFTDYTGGTFSVSNLGMFDVESFQSIINPPEAASLAVGTIREIPVVADGQIRASKRMKVSLSADHRLLDGAVAARFLQLVKRHLEMPVTLW
jgi:pyruvate dehydrogenase E2 component (dihydrolipoamide acetyltransferase)